MNFDFMVVISVSSSFHLMVILPELTSFKTVLHQKSHLHCLKCRQGHEIYQPKDDEAEVFPAKYFASGFEMF